MGLLDDRFKLRWQTTPVEDGWVLTILSVIGTEIGAFWITEDEIEGLIEMLKGRTK